MSLSQAERIKYGQKFNASAARLAFLGNKVGDAESEALVTISLALSDVVNEAVQDIKAFAKDAVK